MRPSLSLVHRWVKKKIAEKGSIAKREDLDDFVEFTGQGRTKFSKWMNQAGLHYDTRLMRWLDLGKRPHPSKYRAWLDRILKTGSNARRFAPIIVKIWGWNPAGEEMEAWQKFLDQQPDLKRTEEVECLDCYASCAGGDEECEFCGAELDPTNIWLTYSKVET